MPSRSGRSPLSPAPSPYRNRETITTSSSNLAIFPKQQLSPPLQLLVLRPLQVGCRIKDFPPPLPTHHVAIFFTIVLTMAIPSTFTSLPQPHATPRIGFDSVPANLASQHDRQRTMEIEMDDGSTGRGILIGMLSASSFAIFIAILIALIYFFRNTTRGRILLDRMGRPGQYDDEQAMLREEAEALETMDDMQRAEYLRAKGVLPVCWICDSRKADNILQHSYKQIHPSRSRQTYRCRSSWPYKKKAFLHGSLNQN